MENQVLFLEAFDATLFIFIHCPLQLRRHRVTHRLAILTNLRKKYEE
jgi:hypothetical protein